MSDSKLRQFLLSRLVAYALTRNSKLIGGALFRVVPMAKKWLLSKGLLNIRLTKESRIIDVGCGSGNLPFLLAEAGFKNAVGIDPFIDSDIIYGNGAAVRKATLEEVSGEYDLIMFQHSFEHMANQLEVLQSVNGLLAESGTCLLNMPTVSSYAWEQFRENWVQLDAPRHLCIHSQNSIEILANKADLKISKVVFNSSGFQFWGSMQYQKGISHCSKESYKVDTSSSIFSDRQISEFERQAKRLNLEGRGDSAAFYLRKQAKSNVQA